MSAILKRNIRLFFRDRTGVFFSLLGVFIIIALYVLFLSDMVIGDSTLPEIKYLMDSWIMAGVLAVTPVTTTMGAYSVMVEDKSKKIIKDFSASPLKNNSLMTGYIASAFIVGVIMSIVALVFAEIYIVVGGGNLLSLVDFLNLIPLILLSNLCGSSFVFLIISFIKTSSAFVTASTILGTLIGFLAGIYIPIGVLPAAMQTVVKVFPISHAAALFRQVMMRDAFSISYAGIPAEYQKNFELQFGVVYKFGDTEIGIPINILIIVGSSIIFYLLALLKLSRKQK